MNSFNNFKILVNIKKFIISLDSLIMTIPKNDVISRNIIMNDALQLYEFVVKANMDIPKLERDNLKIEALVKISKLDFYLERAFKLKYIGEKQLKSKSKQLLIIYKMILSWWKQNGSVL